MFNKKVNKRDIKQLINSIAIFKGLQNHMGLVDFFLHLKAMKLKKNTVLYKEGDVAKDAFILIDGVVEVKRKSISGDDFVVAIIPANKEKHKYGLVGESALCAETTRSGTITSMSDIVGLRITKLMFDNLCIKFPDIGLHVYRVMCGIIQERLYVANRNVVELFNAFVDEITTKEEIHYYSEMIHSLSHSDGEYL